jgi:hypothetical protein
MQATNVRETDAQHVQHVLQDVQAWPHWAEIAQGARKETGLSADAFYAVLPEYQRFMALSSAYRGLGMFSEQVDALWHAHILNTLRYQEFCAQVIGRFVHHLPCSSFELYLLPTASPICKEPPATCTDPWPAPPDPSPVPEPEPERNPDHRQEMRISILECSHRFVNAYIEAYQCVPPEMYTRLAQTSDADGIAQ